MAKIKFNQISSDHLKVSIPSSTPMEIVEQLEKSLTSKGLVEDLSKSTLSTRHFYKLDSKVLAALEKAKNNSDIADRLIQSLENMSGLSKAKKLPYWADTQADVDKYKNQLRSMNSPVKSKTPETPSTNTDAKSPPPNKSPIHGEANVMGDTGASSWTAGGTGRRYAFIKKEKEKKEQQEKKDSKDDLIKTWAKHLPFPNAEEEMARIAAAQKLNRGEDLMANQLANMMNSRAMFNQGHRQPTSEDMLMAGEQMGIGSSEKVIKSQDDQWNNTINNWLVEAAKPINQRFASEEEEISYWNSISIGDRDDGQSGY